MRKLRQLAGCSGRAERSSGRSDQISVRNKPAPARITPSTHHQPLRLAVRRVVEQRKLLHVDLREADALELLKELLALGHDGHVDEASREDHGQRSPPLRLVDSLLLERRRNKTFKETTKTQCTLSQIFFVCVAVTSSLLCTCCEFVRKEKR